MRTNDSESNEPANENCGTEEYDADIIILSFNRLHDTLASVASALSQKDVNARIAILDQGSSKDTLVALKEKIRPYPNVSLFEAAENLGVGGGRNFLSSIGNGKIIVGIDNDAIFSARLSAI